MTGRTIGGPVVVAVVVVVRKFGRTNEVRSVDPERQAVNLCDVEGTIGTVTTYIVDGRKGVGYG
jgi:hypothetical protein